MQFNDTMINQRNSDKNRALRIILLVILDAVCFTLSLFLSLIARFEFDINGLYSNSLFLQYVVSFMPIYTILGIIIFAVFKLYTSLWEFASMDELVRIAVASEIVNCLNYGLMLLADMRLPISLLIINGFILTLLCGTTRIAYRAARRGFHRNRKRKRTMIIGAGKAGALTLREFSSSPISENKVICFIDDDKTKHGSYICGIKVVGGRNRIPAAVEKYNIDEIILAIPSAPYTLQGELLNICQNTNCKLKILPGISQLANNEINVSKIRPVEIEDLLGREPVNVDLSEIMGYVHDRVVLVTGGGGSIGSELCRQIASHGPKTLIIFDIYENNAYSVQLEIRKRWPNVDLQTLIGSVRDEKKVSNLFEMYRPELVFHAAAHKHVPLMEDSPNEAIKNNVFGTYNVARAADKFGAKRMVLISTDKAVNPTNIMGASKRICEMVVQAMNSHSETEYAAVRFGNVLGSNGSVIPLFKKQIADGGPVTVTHKDVIRYFMTIPEAVSLVLQAGSYAKGGEIFILDMGKPVRIDTLARNMIRLSGLEPDVDIRITYTGLRPGEKLYEELLLNEEGMEKTLNSLIYIGHKVEFDEDRFFNNLQGLYEACQNNSPNIRNLVHSMVPEYKHG